MSKVPERIYIDRGPKGGWMHRHERQPDTEHEYIHDTIHQAALDRIAALEAEKATGWAVKPLVWNIGQHERWYARSAVGQYSAREFIAGTVRLDLDGSLLGGPHPTIEAAKAAAEADHIARVTALLEPADTEGKP